MSLAKFSANVENDDGKMTISVDGISPDQNVRNITTNPNYYLQNIDINIKNSNIIDNFKTTFNVVTSNDVKDIPNRSIYEYKNNLYVYIKSQSLSNTYLYKINTNGTYIFSISKTNFIKKSDETKKIGNLSKDIYTKIYNETELPPDLFNVPNLSSLDYDHSDFGSNRSDFGSNHSEFGSNHSEFGSNRSDFGYNPIIKNKDEVEIIRNREQNDNANQSTINNVEDEAEIRRYRAQNENLQSLNLIDPMNLNNDNSSQGNSNGGKRKSRRRERIPKGKNRKGGKSLRFRKKQNIIKPRYSQY